ncbi:MAG: hypothetical protein M4579_000735 [Chaenotheca gracillima]|nr:MAG: hypothetical protein M4579_000735 [Chaenotheca gracillima]
MRSLLSLLTFASLLATALATSVGVSETAPEDPCIRLVNTGSDTDIWVVETSSDVPATAYHGDPITVGAGQSVHFYPGKGFIGALTGTSGTGTRLEVNFGTADLTWYNADMEMGMDDSTLGPTSLQAQANGNPSLAGEPNCLAKANAAWHSVNRATRKALLATGYFQGSVGGILTSLHINKQAPASVVRFLQITAQFNAYVAHGSVDGIDGTQADAVADKQTRSVSTNKLTITKYS